MGVAVTVAVAVALRGGVFVGGFWQPLAVHVWSALNVPPLAKRIRSDFLFAPVAILSIAPTLMWTVYKKSWGLQNDLTAAPSGALSRRLFDGATHQYLLDYLLVRANAIWVVAGLVAVIVIFSVHRRFRLHRGALVALMTSALYVCGLYVVYLSTPHDALTFYLFTSATRTMATAINA